MSPFTRRALIGFTAVSITMMLIYGILGLLPSWLPGFLKFVAVSLFVGTIIGSIAFWYRGSLGQVQQLLASPVAAAVGKTLGITAGLALIAALTYMLVATDTDKYKDFVLKREFVLWMIFAPMITTALLTIYSAVGIPQAYRDAMSRGVWQIAGVGLIMFAVFVWLYPDHTISIRIFAELDRLTGLAAEKLESAADKVGGLMPTPKSSASDPTKPDAMQQPQVRIIAEPPKVYYSPYPGQVHDVDWWKWAAASKENYEKGGCNTTATACGAAIWRLLQNNCLQEVSGGYKLRDHCDIKTGS